ncbi:MAG TPA: hypothetical protein VLW06_02400 [Terriglobales bacterium]|nr:hypothetical protein [Terriglobales bacterium]
MVVSHRQVYGLIEGDKRRSLCQCGSGEQEEKSRTPRQLPNCRSVTGRERMAFKFEAASLSLILKVFKNLPDFKLFMASPYYGVTDARQLL